MAQLNLTDKFIVDRSNQTYKTTYGDIVSSLENDLDMDLYVKVPGDTMTGSLYMDTTAGITISDIEAFAPEPFDVREENKVAFFDNTGKFVSAEPYQLTGENVRDENVRLLSTVTLDENRTATLLNDGTYTGLGHYLEQYPVPGAAGSEGADGFNAEFDIVVKNNQVVSVVVSKPGNTYTVGNLKEINTGVDTHGSGPRVKVETIDRDIVPSAADVSITLNSDSGFVKTSDILFKGENGLQITAGNGYVTFTQASADVDMNIVERSESAPFIDTTTPPFWFNTTEGRMYVQYDNSYTDDLGNPQTDILWVDTNPNTLDGSEFINKTDGICANIDASSTVKAAHFAIDHLPVLP